jgi:hypothetical protein
MLNDDPADHPRCECRVDVAPGRRLTRWWRSLLRCVDTSEADTVAIADRILLELDHLEDARTTAIVDTGDEFPHGAC